MNVEMISALEQLKSTLSRAYNTAERQLREPFADKESVSSYLQCKIQLVLTEIDAFITEEEHAFEAYYSVEAEPVAAEEVSDHSHLSGFPVADSDVLDDFKTPSATKGYRFNPLIHSCAAEITAAFGDCWVEVKALKHNGSHPDYMISIQPSGYTPNDIQLKLKSLGYVPAFKSIKDLDRCGFDKLNPTAWAYFDVVYPRVRGQGGNGITFELSSIVSSTEPPDIERYSEPATDDELPF